MRSASLVPRGSLIAMKIGIVVVALLAPLGLAAIFLWAVGNAHWKVALPLGVGIAGLIAWAADDD